MDTTLSMIGDHPVLRFERQLAHSPEKVWKAVTDPAEMAHWFPATVRTEPKIGASMRFSFEDNLDLGAEYADGEILEMDPPKVYAFRWVDSTLRFELIPDGSGCLLVFTHTLSGVGTEGDLPSVARQAPGWDGCLDMLTARLDGTPAPRMDGPWFLRHAEHYAEKFGLAEGTVQPTGDGYVVRFERDLVPAVDAVWAALTEDDEPVDGQAPPVRFTHGYLTPGTVMRLESPHALEYSWHHEGEPAGRVRFELHHQKPIGCRLIVTQTLPAHLADLRATALAAWQTHLELLFAALYGDVRCPWPTERTETLRQKYATHLAEHG
jgi:uncharacterized protein YndB with AHSA1/START domain